MSFSDKETQKQQEQTDPLHTAKEKKTMRLILFRRTFSYLGTGLVCSALVGGLYGDGNSARELYRGGYGALWMRALVLRIGDTSFTGISLYIRDCSIIRKAHLELTTLGAYYTG